MLLVGNGVAPARSVPHSSPTHPPRPLNIWHPLRPLGRAFRHPVHINARPEDATSVVMLPPDDDGVGGLSFLTRWFFRGGATLNDACLLPPPQLYSLQMSLATMLTCTVTADESVASFQPQS